MLHICLYLGNDGCLLNVHFRYLTSTGWSDSFASALIVITMAKSLRAAHKSLYKQPSLCVSCKNLNVSVADCLPDKITSSSFSFGCSGLTLPFFDDKFNVSVVCGSWIGKSNRNCGISGNKNWFSHQGIIVIPVDLSLRIFTSAAPIKLNGGKAWKFLILMHLLRLHCRRETVIIELELRNSNMTQIGKCKT